METYGLSLRDMEIAEDVASMKATGLSFIDIAKKHGISDRRLRDIRRTKEFQAFHRQRTVEVFGERMSNVLTTIANRAESGDMKAAKLFVDIMGLNAASKIEIKTEEVPLRDKTNEQLAVDLDEMKALIDAVQSEVN